MQGWPVGVSVGNCLYGLHWCGKTQLKGTWYHSLSLDPGLYRSEEQAEQPAHLHVFSLLSTTDAM